MLAGNDEFCSLRYELLACMHDEQVAEVVDFSVVLLGAVLGHNHRSHIEPTRQRSRYGPSFCCADHADGARIAALVLLAQRSQRAADWRANHDQ